MNRTEVIQYEKKYVHCIELRKRHVVCFGYFCCFQNKSIEILSKCLISDIIFGIRYQINIFQCINRQSNIIMDWNDL